jgi:hypothetical protein
MQSLLGLKQEADLKEARITITFNDAVRLFNTQNIMSEIESEVVRSLRMYGASRNDFEILYG